MIIMDFDRGESFLEIDAVINGNLGLLEFARIGTRFF
jgi:hypothetical protein